MPHPHARRVEECIGNGRGRCPHDLFTCAGGWLIKALHHDRRDLWMFSKAQYLIAIPVETGDAMIVEGHFLLEDTANRLDHLAHHLVFDEGRVDGKAAIHRTKKMLGHDHTRLCIDLYFSDRCPIGDVMRAKRDPDASHHLARSYLRAHDFRLPASRLCGRLKNAKPSFIANVPAPEFERVHFDRDGQFINGLLGGKGE